MIIGKMIKLIKNYESRMKDFVLKMAQKPIIIKKERDKFSTSRQEFFASTSNKILDKKGFQFKSYKSDKERINDFLKGKESLDKYLEEISRIKKKKEKIRKKRNEPKLIQPSMRFTARTDLERVYDVLKNREILYDEEKIIKSQLAKMGFSSQNVESDDEGDGNEEESDNNYNSNNNFNSFNNNYNYNSFSNKKNEALSDEEIYKKELHNKIIQQRKNMINKRKFLLDVEHNKKIDNSKAKRLRGELYQRTHFKTMENLTMFRTSTINHNVFKRWKMEDEEKQQNIKIKNINNYHNNLFNGSTFSFFPNLNTGTFGSTGSKMNLKKAPKEFRQISTFDDIVFNDKKNNGNLKNNVMNYYNNIKTFGNNNNNGNNNKEENSFRKNNSMSQKRQFNLIGNKKILEELEITKEIANSNPLLFNLNFNNVKNESSNSPWTIDQLSVLKKMAFEKNENLDDSFSNAPYVRNDYDDLKKEENIIIDGKEYKKSETYKIADKILKKCNYNENKIKYKPYEGGLMFTNGLTVKEFEAKYGL